MLQQVFSAAQLASIPADKLIDLTENREGWFRLVNLSPHLFEIWDERAVIRDVCFPWNACIIRLSKAAAIEGVIIHGLATVGTVPDSGALKVLYEVRSNDPGAGPGGGLSGGGAGGAPAFVEINGANKLAVLTNVSVLAASATRLDSGLASRKSIRLTNDTGNANPIAIGYSNAVTVAVPPAAATDGVLLRPGNSMTFGLGPGLQLWGKAAVANVLIGVEELA